MRVINDAHRYLHGSTMVIVTVLYPYHKDSRFDFAYYTDVHISHSIELLSAHPGFRGAMVERGVGGGLPGSPPTYIAMSHFQFKSLEAFHEAFTPHAQQIQDDIPNFTNIDPIIQFNKVLLQLSS